MRALAAIALLSAVAAAQEEIAGRLLDDEPLVRAAAAKELGDLGPAGAFAVPQLIEAIYDQADAPAKAAIRALGLIGPAAREARAFLVDRALLRGDFEPVVAQALARIGTPDPEAALVTWLRGKGALPSGARTLEDLAKGDGKALEPRLLEALGEKDSIVTAQAAGLLARAARTDEAVATALARLLDHPSACVRLHAAIALAHSSLAESAFGPMLEDSRAERRRAAARHFRGLAALPYLRRALRDEDLQVRRNAAGGFSAPDVRADPGLVVELAATLDRDPLLCSHLSTVLGMLGPAAAPAVPAFGRCLASPDHAVRWAACSALGRIGEKAGPAATALAFAAFDEREEVGVTALGALAAIGPAAKDAAPYVAELAEADLSLGPHARRALAAIGEGAPLPPLPDAAELPALRVALADSEARTAGRAAFAIGRLAATDAGTLEALSAALGHPSPYARRHAALALQRIGPASLPLIARAARDGADPARRLAAATLIHFAGVAPDDLAPVATGLLSSDDPFVKREAIRSLGIAGSPGRSAVPAMIACLSGEDGELVQAAIWALGRMRADASGAVPRLIEILDTGGDGRTAWAAILALGEIGPLAEPAILSIIAAGRRSGTGTELFSPAVEALAHIGPAGHAALVRLIREEKGANRQLPIGALARLNLRPPGLKEALEEVVKDADVQTREIALMAIRGLGPESKPSVDSLVEVLKSGSMDTRARAGVTQSLADAASVDVLLELARDKDPRVCAGAWQALSLRDPAQVTEPERQRALPRLLEALGDARTEVALSAAAALRCVPLRSPDPQVLFLLGSHSEARTQIAQALRALGPGAIPALAKALAAQNPSVRVGAALALAEFGPAARPAVTALRDAALKETGNATPFVRAILLTKDLDVVAAMFREAPPYRRSFGDALAAAGTDALPHMDRLRKDGDPGVRREALLLAPRFGAVAVPWLLKGAEDDATPVAAAAIAGLGTDLVPSEQAIPVLDRACRNAALRADALRALARHGEKALPALRPFVADRDPRVRMQALAVLPAVGAPAVDLLTEALGDDDLHVRVTAARALRECREAALPALPALRRRLADPEPEVRGAVASALGALGAAAVGPLVECLASPDARVREGAVYALRETGGAAAPALPALKRLLDDPDPSVRRATALTLAAFGSTALDSLVRMCKDKDPSVRASAAGALKLLRGAAAPALPALLDMLRDPDGWARQVAARTVGALGKDAEVAVPDLAEMFRRGDDGDRTAAAEALLAIGPAAAPALAAFAVHPDKGLREPAQQALAQLGAAAVPALVALVYPDDEKARREAAATLARIGAPAVPALEKMLNHEDPGVRRDAAWALGTVGSPARGAVAALAAVLDDKDGLVPQQAAWALGQMGPAAHAALPALEEMYAAGRHRVIVADAIRRIRGE